jgi:hypothetical protein
MALELAVISLVAGVVLGLRYKVLILVPAVMFAMMFALMAMALAVAVQMGYLAGIFLRAVVEWICALLIRNRSPGLSALGPVWPHTGHLNNWAVRGAVAHLRQPQSPQT